MRLLLNYNAIFDIRLELDGFHRAILTSYFEEDIPIRLVSPNGLNLVYGIQKYSVFNLYLTLKPQFSVCFEYKLINF